MLWFFPVPHWFFFRYYLKVITICDEYKRYWNNGMYISNQVNGNTHARTTKVPEGCFTNVSRALQNNLAKIYNARNHIYGENFKLKLCACAQSMALGTRTKFQLEILIRSTTSAIHKFRNNILESSRNVSEITPRYPDQGQLYMYIVACWFQLHTQLQVQPKNQVHRSRESTGDWFKFEKSGAMS